MLFVKGFVETFSGSLVDVQEDYLYKKKPLKNCIVLFYFLCTSFVLILYSVYK